MKCEGCRDAIYRVCMIVSRVGLNKDISVMMYKLINLPLQTLKHSKVEPLTLYPSSYPSLRQPLRGTGTLRVHPSTFSY